MNIREKSWLGSYNERRVYMASGKILRQLIKAGTNGDIEAFKEASLSVIREERQKQHHLLANELERILHGDNYTTRTVRHGLNEQVPVDKERNLPLLILREPNHRLDEVVLDETTHQIIGELLEQHNRADVLKSYGLRPTDKVLFCGPPGCGKTLTAEAIALELDRPLAIIRLDSVVSSYLGETAANLRKVFDFIDSTPTIALFDEFDALGKERVDSSDHGELKRVVNAVLQMLDTYQGKSLIIAATNHESTLDTAIWRRFEEILLFTLPNCSQITQLLTIKLRGVKRDFEIDNDDKITLQKLFEGMSHADIERVLRRAIKSIILRGQEFLQINHLEKSLAHEAIKNNKLSQRLTQHGQLSLPPLFARDGIVER